MKNKIAPEMPDEVMAIGDREDLPELIVAEPTSEPAVSTRPVRMSLVNDGKRAWFLPVGTVLPAGHKPGGLRPAKAKGRRSFR